MSGIIKSVTKAFKKVVPNLRKILPYGLAIGALVFTAGAALGALPSWGTAVQGVVAKLGISETMAGILTGAVTQAGYGAALGAGGAFLTGKDPGKGALLGALTGAVTGGVSGGMGYETDPLKSLNPDTGAPAGVPGPTEALDAPEADEWMGKAGASGFDPLNNQSAALPSDAPEGDIAGGARRNLYPAPTDPTFNDNITKEQTFGPRDVAPKIPSAGADANKGWLERHQTLVGSTIQGAGRAGAQFFASGADADSQQKARDQRAANYRTGTRGLYNEPPADPTNARAPVPTATGDMPRTPQTVGSYQYNKEKGQLEFVKEGA